MFESMVGSMTTSMDLARSFVEEQGDVHLESDDQQVKGIDALARLIEIGKFTWLLVAVPNVFFF